MAGLTPPPAPAAAPAALRAPSRVTTFQRPSPGRLPNMPVPIPVRFAVALSVSLPAPAQEPLAPAYPERDILSPFREPTDVYAPPDELFRHLRVMQNLAGRLPDKVSYDDEGREVVDDPSWRAARARVEELGLDAGMLAQMMRLHRDGAQRDTAFYAAFHVDDVNHVLELISHIPGEPQRRTREAALRRAVPFVRAHLARRFGDLSPEQQQAVRQAIPEPGSPTARAQGITRAPLDSDHLHGLRLVPFFQLMDRDDPLDQAQALWFLKEVFRVRRDLAELWLEPALPRVHQILIDGSAQARAEAVELLQGIGPDDLGPPPDDVGALLDWAERAGRHMFPPIRNLNDTIVQLYPSPERDAIVTAGTKALENSGIGDPFRGQKDDGQWFRGFRVGHVPDALSPLAIPAEAVITGVNGAAVGTAQELLQVVRQQVQGPRPRRLLVEYVHGGKLHAIEYRIM